MLINLTEMNKIKAAISKNTGKRIKLTTKKGKKRAVIRHGVIEGAYKSIFVVMLDSAIDELPSSMRRVSFSYTDLLTNAIEVRLCNDNATA